MDPALPAIGTLVGQKYRIDGVIGEGGMGVVFAATHEKLGQLVAIKMLLPELARHPELVARFGREARASAQLRHRNSARVIDVDETTNGIPYMVMERLHGHDLETELDARGKLEIPEAVQFVIEACAAMSEAHRRGIVHRDLKPSNLFLSTEDDGSVCVKVLDFGISKVQNEDGRITSTQHQMGTPLYMSPEQVRSAKSVDARTDVWSLGVILYELLTGETPFKGSTAGIGAAIVGDTPTPVRELRPEIPGDLELAITKAMAKSPADRFVSMQEMISALAPFSPNAKIATDRASPPRLDSQSSEPSLGDAPTLAAPIPAPARTFDPAEPTPAANATAGSWVKVKPKSDASRRTPWIVAAALVGTVGVGAFALSRGSRQTTTSTPSTSDGLAHAAADPSVAPSATASIATAAPSVLPAAPASSAATAPASSSAPASSASTSPKAHAAPSAKPVTSKPAAAPKPIVAPLNENPARL